MTPQRERQKSVAQRVGEWCVTAPTNRWLRWLPSVGWASLISLLSSIPGYRFPKVPIPEADKGMHALLFFPLGFLVARSAAAACPGGSPFSASSGFVTRLIGAFVLCAAYGLLDEIHQLFVPRRTFSLADWAVDCVAAAMGIVAWRMLHRRYVRLTAIGS